jgi:hypothetical protein
MRGERQEKEPRLMLKKYFHNTACGAMSINRQLLGGAIKHQML